MFRFFDFEFDWRSKLWVFKFLGESSDEAEQLLEELKIVTTDPDLVDQEAAAVRMVQLVYQIKRNYQGDPKAAFGQMQTPSDLRSALAMLPRSKGKLGELMKWALENWDKISPYLASLLLLIFGDELPALLKAKQVKP